MAICDLISRMRLTEKLRFCTGADFWRTKELPRLSIPSLTMSDGPHGLRCQSGQADMIGVHDSLPATCFPAAVTAGSAWNPQLYAAEGVAIGEEARAQGVDVVLGPGCNLKRDPRCGRNFEYLSEDPYLAGKLAATFIQGLQSTGVAASLKHFAANNQEYKRQNGDSQVDDRALRELYLSPFEIAVKEGHPKTVMCSYNKINGTHASDNRWLLTEVLRQEWGFSGVVVTDWGALCDRVQAFRAGCDLNMPGGSRYMERTVRKAIQSGQLDARDIDASVGRLLSLAESCGEVPKGGNFDIEAHNALSCTIAEEGAVLLQNNDSLLPAPAEDFVLIGNMAKDFRYQGSGSSHINPTRLTTLTDALPKVPVCLCGDAQGRVTDQELKDAAIAARSRTVAVVVAGLPDCYESEGFDRMNLTMPEGYVRLIETVAEVNPNTVVVLLGGSPMETRWRDKVKSILYLGLPGQAGGLACARLLTGVVTPGGKLTESWPESTDDLVTQDTFGVQDPEYRESVYMGYRYYDSARKTVAFPFGHGLSYTDFSYSDLEVSERAVSATITNVGSRTGDEVVQLYIAPPQNGLFRPAQELKGFQKVRLEPGLSKRVTFPLNRRSFALWQDGWKVPGGRYELRLAASSRDIRLRGVLTLAGEPVTVPDWQETSWYTSLDGRPSREDWERQMGHPVSRRAPASKGSFTMDNSCLEMKDFSWIMGLHYRVAKWMVRRSFRGSHDPEGAAWKMMLSCATDCPIRATVICAGGRMPEWFARAVVWLVNHPPFFQKERRLRFLERKLGKELSSRAATGSECNPRK